MPDICADKLARTTGEGCSLGEDNASLIQLQRLNEQFDLITRNISYLIHPRVIAALHPDPRIADIGTGIGHFLRCVQESGAFANATVHGYDISASMYPESPPKNIISLKVLDINQPVPEELIGIYDLVHARMLVAAVLPTEWTAIVRNLVKLLKAGGWLQWGEYNFISAKFLRGDTLGSPRTDTVVELSDRWREEMRDMRAKGLEIVESDCVSSDRLPETRKKATENAMTAIFSWLCMMALKGAGMTVEELECAEKRATGEIEAGAYVRYEIYAVTGQKAL